MHVFRGDRRARRREDVTEHLDIETLRRRVGGPARPRATLPPEARFIRIDGPEARPAIPRRSWRDAVMEA